MASNNVSTVIAGSNLGGISAGQINISEGNPRNLCKIRIQPTHLFDRFRVQAPKNPKNQSMALSPGILAETGECIL